MSPKGGNYCESTTSVNLAVGYANEFPSPTGVSYYESWMLNLKKVYSSFHPQQGLTIMNAITHVH